MTSVMRKGEQNVVSSGQQGSTNGKAGLGLMASHNGGHGVADLVTGDSPVVSQNGSGTRIKLV